MHDPTCSCHCPAIAITFERIARFPDISPKIKPPDAPAAPPSPTLPAPPPAPPPGRLGKRAAAPDTASEDEHTSPRMPPPPTGPSATA
eukprot:5446199-Prymnesium_polylepis.1